MLYQIRPQVPKGIWDKDGATDCSASRRECEISELSRALS